MSNSSNPNCPLCGGLMAKARATGASHRHRHRVCPDCEAIAWRSTESPTGGSGPGKACTLCNQDGARLHVVAEVAGAVVRVCGKCHGVHIVPSSP